MESLQRPEYVESELNYLRYSGERPVKYFYPAPPRVRQESFESAPYKVRIWNARRLAERPTLERNGFRSNRTVVP
jgi:hypothetical protein